MRRLILLFSAFLAVNSFATSGPYQSERFLKNNGGKIDHISPLLVPNENLSDVQNITLDDRGQYSKRNGYTVISSTNALVGKSTWVVTGIGYHQSTVGSNFFGVIAGSAAYRTSTQLSSYSNVTGSATITVDVNNLAQTTSLNDKLLFCNEDDPPFYFDSSNNAVLADTTSVITGAKTCSTYGNYVILANTVESAIAYPSRVRWSDLNNIAAYPTLNYIDVEPDSGDSIVGMVQYEDSVYIFKHHSIYRMLITGSDGPDAFIIRPVVRTVGAYAKNTIKVIPSVGVVFLSQNTVYVLNGSYASQYSEKGLTPIGDPIQRTLDTVDRVQWKNAVGEVYPKHYQYWLAVSTGSSSNGLILVYDYAQNAWTTYTDMTIAAMAAGDDSNGNTVLVTGDKQATTYKQDNTTQDNPHGVVNNVPASLTTGNITLNNPELTKGFKWLYVWTQTFSTGTLTVNAAYDFSANYDFSQTVSASATTPLYDTAIYDKDVFPGTSFNVYRMELNRSARTIRLQFVNNDAFSTTGIVVGWTLVYSIEDYKE